MNVELEHMPTTTNSNDITGHVTRGRVQKHKQTGQIWRDIFIGLHILRFFMQLSLKHQSWKESCLFICLSDDCH